MVFNKSGRVSLILSRDIEKNAIERKKKKNCCFYRFVLIRTSKSVNLLRIVMICQKIIVGFDKVVL